MTEGLDKLDRPETPDLPEPVLAIRGDATAEEVAALVVVLRAVAAAAAEREPRRRPGSEWASPRRSVRRPHPSGPGAWRASALAP